MVLTVSMVTMVYWLPDKDKMLKGTWAKKIIYKGRVVSIAHDFPAEVNYKLKEYKDTNKILNGPALPLSHSASRKSLKLP